MKYFVRVSGVGAIGAVFAVASACGSTDPIAIGAGARGGTVGAAGGSSATGGGGSSSGSSGSGGSGGSSGADGSDAGDGADISAGSGGTGAAGAEGSDAGGATGPDDGSGDSGEATDGSDSGDLAKCSQAEALVKAQAQRLGCEDNSAVVKADCVALHAARLCLAELRTFVDCAAAAANSGWSCLNDGGPVWVEPCTAAANAYLGCRSVCSSISNTGSPTINVQKVAQALPAGTGGTIRDGIYFQTKYEKYTGLGGETGPTAETHRQTIVVSGAGSGTASVRSATWFGMDPDVQEVFAMVIGTTTLAVSLQCPDAGDPVTIPFTASGAEFAIINPTESVVETFTRQ
jgi:hypothetical protein